MQQKEAVILTGSLRKVGCLHKMSVQTTVKCKAKRHYFADCRLFSDTKNLMFFFKWSDNKKNRKFFWAFCHHSSHVGLQYACEAFCDQPVHKMARALSLTCIGSPGNCRQSPHDNSWLNTSFHLSTTDFILFLHQSGPMSHCKAAIVGVVAGIVPGTGRLTLRRRTLFAFGTSPGWEHWGTPVCCGMCWGTCLFCRTELPCTHSPSCAPPLPPFAEMQNWYSAKKGFCHKRNGKSQNEKKKKVIFKDSRKDKNKGRKAQFFFKHLNVLGTASSHRGSQRTYSWDGTCSSRVCRSCTLVSGSTESLSRRAMSWWTPPSDACSAISLFQVPSLIL